MIADLIQNDYEESDIELFIEDFGIDNFYLYFEDYADAVNLYGYDAVDTFVREYGIENVGTFEERYMGFHESFLDFSVNYFNRHYGYMVDNVVFNYVDYEKFSNDLEYSFDYVYGYVFAKYPN